MALLIRGMSDLTRVELTHACVIAGFMSELAELLSALYTVSFTLQRFIAVRYPLQEVTRCRSSPIIRLGLIFLLSTMYCFIFSRHHYETTCYTDEVLDLGWFIADVVSSFVIPFSLIIVFNVLIISFIRKDSRSPVGVPVIRISRRSQLETNATSCRHGHIVDEEENNTSSGVALTFLDSDEPENLGRRYSQRSKTVLIEIGRRERQSSARLVSIHHSRMGYSCNSIHLCICSACVFLLLIRLTESK